MNTVYGYARVSTAEQNLERQREALGDVDKLITEKKSGRSSEDREALQSLLFFAGEGDTIRVKSIDRLARNTRDLLDIAEQLAAKGVRLEFVDQPNLSMTNPGDKFILTIYAGFAEMERALIRDRQAEGIAIAKAEGKYNKAAKLSAEQVAEAKRRKEEGVAVARIARDLGVSRNTVYAALNGTGKYASADD